MIPSTLQRVIVRASFHPRPDPGFPQGTPNLRHIVAIFRASRKGCSCWWTVACTPSPSDCRRLMLPQATASAAVPQSPRTSVGNCDLAHLEGDAAAVADDLGTDLDRLLLHARQRPALDGLWRRQRAQEIAKAGCQRV